MIRALIFFILANDESSLKTTFILLSQVINGFGDDGLVNLEIKF